MNAILALRWLGSRSIWWMCRCPPCPWTWAPWSSSIWWLRRGRWSRPACRGWDSCSYSMTSPPRPESKRSAHLLAHRSSSQREELRPRRGRRSRQRSGPSRSSSCSAWGQLLACRPRCSVRRRAGWECRETPGLRDWTKITVGVRGGEGGREGKKGGHFIEYSWVRKKIMCGTTTGKWNKSFDNGKLPNWSAFKIRSPEF